MKPPYLSFATMLLPLCVLLSAGQAPSSPTADSKQREFPEPPSWAYVVNPPAANSKTEKPADSTPLHVPESPASFTAAQVGDFFNPPDWHPENHPPMPDIVSRGKAPDVYACGYCHLPNGEGRPENASLAGLPVGYIVQQVADFKGGARKSSESRHAPTNHMIAIAKAIDQNDVRIAAEYFFALRPRPWIRVVETETVPVTNISGWMLVPSEPDEREAIGRRIIETAENLERTELRDDHSGFVAYVPAGSLKKGKTLVETGGGKTPSCSTCHGVGLKGLGNVPALAGRSPSYIVRQLYDMRSGARAGTAAQKMKPAVANLTLDDMVAIAAYTASLTP
jgi:cytochrome c553